MTTTLPTPALMLQANNLPKVAHVTEIIGEDGALTSLEVTAALDSCLSTCSKYMSGAEALGLIERERSDAKWRLTPTGDAFLVSSVEDRLAWLLSVVPAVAAAHTDYDLAESTALRQEACIKSWLTWCEQGKADQLAQLADPLLAAWEALPWMGRQSKPALDPCPVCGIHRAIAVVDCETCGTPR